MLDKVQLAYIAGIIDANDYKLFVVYHSNLKLVRRLKAWFGGHISKIQEPILYYYQWELKAINEQRKFLEQIEPFLFIRHTQAVKWLSAASENERGKGELNTPLSDVPT